MEVPSVLHMIGGDGETSYSNNSIVQKTAISKARPFLEATLTDLYCTTFPECLRVADLGCSSGPNTLLVISEIIEVIEAICHEKNRISPELQVFLNDLPGNDFNSIFKSLPNFYGKLKKQKGEESGRCFISGVPGSFYGRLFPSTSLHFVHSSYSVHWLSQVPRGLESNKGNIYIGKASPPGVLKAYLEQFQRDFSKFLTLRSQEIVHGGRIFLTFLGRRSADPSSKECCYIWELLAKSLMNMVSEGLVEDAKLDSFNLPCYLPTAGEVRAIVAVEGSFIVDQLEFFDVNWDANDDDNNKDFVFDKCTSGKNVAKGIRAVAESMLTTHFGEAIIDDLFSRYTEHVAEHLSKEKTKHVNLVISMTKK
ncbi:hypothetical protein HHK36_008549 [Tetracentron sinense]|uniref:Uncharacterized protein n=1 Tax=Tetracentron sinense TaxID=13715 RepID=A0A834ZQD0_TETSI|nr:hypothetical protein HHK36_008549 [Tetracentron sinense]